MYEVPQEVELGVSVLDEVSHGGWILKAQKIIEDVSEVTIENGEIISFTQDGEELHFGKDTKWNETYTLKYRYQKQKQSNWALILDVEDKNDNVISSLNLTKQQEIDIEDVQDEDSLINIFTYEPDKQIRQKIIHGIRNLDKWKTYMVKKIADLLYNSNSNYGIRYNAANLLGKKGNNFATDALCISLLNDKNANVRSMAALALGNIKDPRAMEFLIGAVINRDENINIRSNAIFALGEIGNPKATKILTDILFGIEAPPKLKIHSATALRKIEGNNAQSVLEQALYQNSDSTVRVCILHELAKISNRKVVETLINFLKNDDVTKGKRVIETIEEVLAVKGKAYIKVLIEAYRKSKIKNNMVNVFKKIGQAAVEPMIKLVKENISY